MRQFFLIKDRTFRIQNWHMTKMKSCCCQSPHTVSDIDLEREREIYIYIYRYIDRSIDRSIDRKMDGYAYLYS